MLTRKSFYFLRHGETDWNKAGRLQGHTDIELNQTGREQAISVRPLMKDLGIRTMCVSPLSRASETAALAMGEYDWTRHDIDDLKEVTIGVHDGQIFGPWYQEWKAGKRVLEGAETRVEFRERCLRGVNKALENVGPVLIVSHGGVYSALKERIPITPELDLSNCMLLQLNPVPDSSTDWRATLLTEMDPDFFNPA
jgi:broad specificity phosphatase PhoE